jgi:hypothetical protein
LLALLGLVAIELTYLAVAHPARIAWNAFLDYQFTQTESFQRLVAYEKITAFEQADPDIVQVGDSSGLHGVQPPVVMSYIPGFSYLNMGVATNLGYSGYYNLAKFQLEHNRNVRYLVIYTSPLGGVPRKILWDEGEKLMAPLIHSEFVSPFHRLFQLPTLSARRAVTDFVYYMGFRFKKRNEVLSPNRGYLAFHAIFRQSGGWTRETDVEGDIPANIYQAILPGVTVNETANPAAIRYALAQMPKVTDETFFDWLTLSRKSYFDEVYGAFVQLARDHGAKLVVIFNPLPLSSKRPEFDALMDWKSIYAGIERVKKNNPDIIFSDIDFWPDEKFSVFSHISTQHAVESSQRVGRIMKEVIGGARARKVVQNAEGAARPSSLVMDFDEPFCGYGWTDQAARTNGFPLPYIGPRNRAWVYTALKPGGDYTVRSYFLAEDETLPQRIELKVNDITARKLGSGREKNDLYADWLVPAQAVDMYRGWLSLEFFFTGETSKPSTSGTSQDDIKRTIQFRRIVANPYAS